MKPGVMAAVLLLALNVFADKVEYIKSIDDIIFHTPDMFKFADAGKISEFKGVIDRVYFTASDMKLVDLYQFGTDKVKVDKQLCFNFIEKIFSIHNSKIFKFNYMRIENSNKGSVCEAYLADKNVVKEDPYLRLITVGFVNAKATVLVFHPVSTVTDDKITEMRKFWNNLR
ncbi:MAG: hypothetical protein ACXVAX_05405 [Pseudobdellovibrio sp.]